jgi:hypothetical protein
MKLQFIISCFFLLCISLSDARKPSYKVIEAAVQKCLEPLITMTAEFIRPQVKIHRDVSTQAFVRESSIFNNKKNPSESLRCNGC